MTQQKSSDLGPCPWAECFLSVKLQRPDEHGADNHGKLSCEVKGHKLKSNEAVLVKKSSESTYKMPSPSYRPTFSYSSPFCMLMLKFVDQCKEQAKLDHLEENGYMHICPSMPLLRPLIKAAILRFSQSIKFRHLYLNIRIDATLPTTFLDDDTVLLEKNEDRDRVVGGLCEDYSSWEDIFVVSPQEAGKWDKFQADMYFYASENLMQVTVYIRYQLQENQHTNCYNMSNYITICQS